MYKFVIFLSTALLFLSCKKNATSSIQHSFLGYYKVKEITSTVAVDMNNDGLKSVDLYSEISGLFITINGERISFYNFESIANYLKVQSLYNQPDRVRLIAFNFPHQVIDYMSNNIPFLMTYNNEFLSYVSEFTSDNNIHVTSGNPAYYDQIGTINNLTLKEDGNLTVGLKKRVFDFVGTAWQEIDIVVEYVKVP